MSKAVEAYRKAAMELYGANRAEVEAYIVDPKDDPGEHAPGSLAIIYMEPNFTFPEDTGVMPENCCYEASDWLLPLAEKAGIGYIDFANGAVAFVSEA